MNYRSSRLVGGLLETIARRGDQWLTNIVVADNASGDDSIGILQEKVAELRMDDRVKVLDSGQNRGFGAGNNFAARVAIRANERPDVLWFLNPDTRVDDVDLKLALQWFKRDSSVGIVGTALEDGQGESDLGGHNDLSPLSEFVRLAGVSRFLRRYAVSDPALDRPGRVDWVSGASLIIRTSAFENIGGFDEGFFLYFEEVDLCRRVRKAGYSVIFEPRARIVHLEGQSTGIGQNVPRPRYWYESRRRYFLKHFGRTGLLCADVAWALGRFVGALRRRKSDGCCWHDLWQCDGPVILGNKRITTTGMPE